MPSTLRELAALVGAALDLADQAAADVPIAGVAELDAAGPHEIALFSDPRRLEQARATRAAALVVARRHDELAAVQLVVSDPRLALARLLAHFAPPLPAREGVDARAVVEAGARIHASAWVGPMAYVGREAVVGPHCRLDPFAYLGEQAQLGARCWLQPSAVVLDRCRLGDEVIVGPGAVVGHAGFSYVAEEDRLRLVPSASHVEIEARVEIGANTCVDRGTLAPTRVGAGTKLDNLVQVGHNGALGANVLVCAQVGLAGSVQIGDGAVLGGQVGVADHLHIGRGAKVAAQSGVARDVPDGATVAGYPALAHRRWLRLSAWLARIAARGAHKESAQ